jgi:hypothetical protein
MTFGVRSDQTPVTLKFEQIRPILASLRLRRLELSGINIVGHDTVERYPPFEYLSFGECDNCYGIAEAIRAVRCPRALNISASYDGERVAPRQIVDTFTKDITRLYFDTVSKDTIPRPFSFQHYIQLQELHIRAEMLAALNPKCMTVNILRTKWIRHS